MYIIFPIECLDRESGLMVGTKNECGKILCVVNVVAPALSKKICKEIKGGSVLGHWYGVDTVSPTEIAQESSSKLMLQSQGRQVPEVHSAEDDELVLVLYDRKIMYSYFTTTPLALRETASEPEPNTAPGKVFPILPLPSFKGESHTETILKQVNDSEEMAAKINALLHPKKIAVFRLLFRILNYILLLPNFFLGVLVYTSSILVSFSKLGVFQWRVSSFLTSLPVFLFQYSHRLSQLQFLGKNTGNPLHSSENTTNIAQQRSLTINPFEEFHKKQRILIIKGNILATIILDVFLGITIVYLMSSSTLIENIVNNLVHYTDYVAQLLVQLINWLMGVPGGLKLNKTLTNFLGKFFLYHIYLWQTYLQVIQPYLQPVLRICIISGCLGMTFLISMASDVFSLLTLHIYFFYVYAARLYSLQIYAILSLSRLFTGKKWSVLRNRVDSLPYDVDRLFIGTLLFTVLLFLLPTTALFYVVFTTLRLLVLVFKFFLSSSTHLLNKVPLFGLGLLILRPSMLPGGLQVNVIPSSTSSNKSLLNPSSLLPPKVQVLCIQLYNKPLSVIQLFDWSISPSDSTSVNKQETWASFVMKLVRGQLVYPWIERD